MSLRDRILTRLARGPAVLATIAKSVGFPPLVIQTELNAMLDAGVIGSTMIAENFIAMELYHIPTPIPSKPRQRVARVKAKAVKIPAAFRHLVRK